MDKYLDLGSPARGRRGASNRSAGASAAAPAPRASNSRLSTLLGKPRPAPAKGLDVAVIDSLSVGDGEPAAKRSKRSSRSSGGGGGSSSKRQGASGASGASDATGSHETECLDVTASPPQRAIGRPVASARVARGGGDITDGFAARFGQDSNSSSRGESGGTSNGVKRKSSTAAVSRGGGARGSSTGGGGSSSNKMGPWARRPEQKAICEEEGYDPLELMEDANREIFGNDAFRGIQEEVSG